MHTNADDTTSIIEQPNYQKARGNTYSALQPALNTASVVKMTVENLHENCRREGENKRLVNNVMQSSLAEDCNVENIHWSESQSRLPVCVSGIYGLVSSSRENAAVHQHNGSKNSQDKNRGNYAFIQLLYWDLDD
jgi:IS30 family transposase